MQKRNNDYSKITKIAISYGLKKTNKAGVYELSGKKIDLTASGETDWAVAKEIINQFG